MHHLLTLLIAGTFALGANAQPTLTFAVNAPVAGTNYTLHYGTWTAPGGSGPDQVWDFSGLGTDSSLTVQYTAPGNTANGTQFPDASIAEVNDVVTQYYRVATDGIHFAGSDDGTSVIVHAPQGTYLPFPCTIGTTWSSPQNANFTVEDHDVVRTGTFSGQADGYGTLLMPGGSIPNVLRVHWVHDLEDDMGFFSMSHTYDSFAYFVAGQSYPIAEVVTASINFGGGTQTRQFTRWTGDFTTAIAEEQPAILGLFPNPASDEVTLNWPAALGTPSTVTITDMAGRTVVHRYLIATQVSSARIDLSSIFPGLYQVTLTSTAGKRITGRLSVQ